MRLGRRQFLGTLVAAAAAPFIPIPVAPQKLMCHPDAFALAMVPGPPLVTRLDVIYGFRTFTPEVACRILAY